MAIRITERRHAWTN